MGRKLNKDLEKEVLEKEIEITEEETFDINKEEGDNSFTTHIVID